MYEKYTTEAFVISSRVSGEADKILTLYTKDFGLLKGLLTGGRNIKSKLNGFTQNGNAVFVTLVRGKRIWRITDISAREEYKVKKDNLKILLKTFLIIKTMIQGEEKNEALFEGLKNIFSYLAKQELFDDKRSVFECIASIRVLFELGYIDGEEIGISVSGEITDFDISTCLDKKDTLVKKVNKAFIESHLVI